MARIKFPTDLANELEQFVPANIRGPRKIAQRVEFACRLWVRERQGMKPAPAKANGSSR
jgi:hypothetical protein